MMFSIVIPVYKNEASLPRLIAALTELKGSIQSELEVVFVVDGSPDNSFGLLKESLTSLPFPTQLLLHSRNFGSFAAIRTGLKAARGDCFGVMAADLQEPPELMVSFAESLQKGECDVVVGTRTGRDDPFFSRIASQAFWSLYRKYVVQDMPSGGVDVFGCNRQFRDQLLELQESRSSLVALIFWLGFRRKLIAYSRQARQEGSSGWTFRKKLDYMLDSIFAFSDAPIRALLRLGFIGCFISILLMVMVFIAKIVGDIQVPGYTATLLVVLFFGALNMFSLGIVGTYAWRTYENSKQRPLAVTSLIFNNFEKHHD
ncbi:glycosyltransferase involved in cell wall biosynthesis [Comamonas sp. BIGb0152]|uniref:glycosyltransferase family 2 protein n=1 Tax=Comamonas sp. BIGb0152 TaxID=2940601 RepID=UPI0021674095|nr:glycosyltransferase family 2 protein [Comamonas sp. BIGb0152]MCS4294633.1 glycosyltransferase involved in cell wall biosynthesis [Comamonas sp. BIGb0152]